MIIIEVLSNVYVFLVLLFWIFIAALFLDIILLVLGISVKCVLRIVNILLAILDIKNRYILYINAIINEVLFSVIVFFVSVAWTLLFSMVLLVLYEVYLKQRESPTHDDYTVHPYNSYPIQRPHFTTVPQCTPELNQSVTAACRKPIHQPYFTTGPQHTPRSNQPATAACRQPIR